MWLWETGWQGTCSWNWFIRSLSWLRRRGTTRQWIKKLCSKTDSLSCSRKQSGSCGSNCPKFLPTSTYKWKILTTTSKLRSSTRPLSNQGQSSNTETSSSNSKTLTSSSCWTHSNLKKKKRPRNLWWIKPKSPRLSLPARRRTLKLLLKPKRLLKGSRSLKTLTSLRTLWLTTQTSPHC